MLYTRQSLDFTSMLIISNLSNIYISPGKCLDEDEGVAAVDDLVPELDDGERAPLRLLPAAADDPLLHLLHKNPEHFDFGDSITDSLNN